MENNEQPPSLANYAKAGTETPETDAFYKGETNE